MSAGMWVFGSGIVGTGFFLLLFLIIQPLFRRQRRKTLEDLSKGYE